jgi:hypothetical protein
MDAADSGQRWPEARNRMLRAVGCPLGSFAQQNSLAERSKHSPGASLERGGDFPHKRYAQTPKKLRINERLPLARFCFLIPCKGRSGQTALINDGKFPIVKR